jgi:outer membrane protein assembly factor BamB
MITTNGKGFRIMRINLTAATISLACAFTAHGQFGRGANEWSTSSGDAHRSSAVPSDPKISKESLSKPGFALFWKIKLNNEPRQLNSLTPPTLLDRHIGIHGFRSFGFVAGSGDNLYAIDTDLARIEWQKNFGKAPAGASATCPGGMTAGTARPAGVAFPAVPAGRGGFGRATPAKSGVGEPDEGGVTLKELAARAAAATPAGRGGRGPDGGARPPRAAVMVYSLSSDGMFHANYVSNGDEPNPPIRFVPPNANAQGLTVIDNVAYVATSGSCGGAPNGIWALDIASKTVNSWKPASGDIAGSAGPAFGPDGTLYVSTTTGDLVSLEAKTLKMKDAYRAGQELESSPVIFPHKEKTMVAATTKDGRIHVVDAAAMSAPGAKSGPNTGASSLATWQDSTGTRWILAPTKSAIAAWKLAEQNGAPALESGWVSRDLASPGTPVIVNGVVFALSTGQRPVLYALDAANGKELWNSGNVITSPVRRSALSAGAGQVYFGAHDGTLYSFGFPIEH